MADPSPSAPDSRPAEPVDRRWWLAGVAVALTLCGLPLVWGSARPDSCYVPLGFGLALTAWLGFRIVPLYAFALFAVQLPLRGQEANTPQALIEIALTGGEIALAWWFYHQQAGGSRRLDDPRSATIFLLLAPGLFAGAFAVLHAANLGGISPPEGFWAYVLKLWLGRALGIVAVAPALLVVATPWLIHYGLAYRESTDRRFQLHPRLLWTLGEVLETTGLAIGAGVLGLVLATLHARETTTNWHFWGLLLLVTVWASLRLGLRGGSVAAATATFVGMLFAQGTADEQALFALRGNLFAQCCTALLIGASADWIRASETRYRQIVGHIPVVLYSARFLRKPTAGALHEIEILLVSPASRTILHCEPESLLGSYRRWLERIHPADRELLQAALAQLLMQNQPVTCEYRLEQENGSKPPAADFAAASSLWARSTPGLRWVRDTLAPHHGADGEVDGWEGVVEDITEQRTLAHDLRRTSNMLHALVAHLPTGVFFVHGKQGQPLLVNARARQLLGQREDLAAGLNRLSAVYRLHRPDGKPYPWEELPVTMALRDGTTTMRDDIIVHRPDGRKTPLVTWAAPVNLGPGGEADAAVWVLEDLTALRQAEAARQETELRLRVVIETMAEGLVVQTPAGAIVECNPAACAILGVEAEDLRGRNALGPGGVCLREDGTALPRDQQPDRVSLHTGQPVRGLVLGVAVHNQTRWILTNSMPVSVTDKLGDSRGQRVVTTFSDITAHRQALEVLRRSEEQYRGLVDTLPMMLLQFDQNGGLIYHNPAAAASTGFKDDELAAPGFWQSRVHGDDAEALAGLLEAANAGQSTRAEFRYRAADGTEQVGYALAQPRRPAGATLLVVDMTQRRRMEQEYQKVQRLELVARIAGGVVHDFNNLLTVVLSYAELAKQSLGDHPAGRDLEHISQAAEHAVRLASQLLAFSKQRQVVMRPVDLNAVVQQAVKLLRPTLPFSIETQLRTSPQPLEVMADESPLQQVVMNLCLNARDAMPAGGELRVETNIANLVAGDTTIADAPAATGGVRWWARLTVQDTGGGMDDAVKARIFEPLFTTKERGSGLGLAVVKQIVEGFGGCIRVESTLGKGARFDVWLPVHVA